jgi:hypothetical protein
LSAIPQQRARYRGIADKSAPTGHGAFNSLIE